MKYGLTQRDVDQILAVFRKFPQIQSVVLFGSRAIGNEKPGSDVDLALKGQTTPSLASRVGAVLNEETNLPYFFDVIDYHSVERKEFLEHIRRHGLEIYHSISPTEEW